MDGKELRKAITAKTDKTVKEFARADFWHYTSIDKAEKIVYGDTPGFFASRLDRMNDIDEAELHNDEKERLFVLSFCNTGKEKIPMWYMYSGLEGKGVGLGMTPGRMKKFINTINVVNPVNGTALSKKFVKGVDFDIYAGWVVYRNPKEPNNYHFKSDWHDNIDPNFEKENYFIKLYPWYYEDEFRIVFKFKEPIEYKSIYIPTPTNLKFKAIYGPGFGGNKKAPDTLLDKSKLLKSSFSDLKIRMNLRERHKK